MSTFESYRRDLQPWRIASDTGDIVSFIHTAEDIARRNNLRAGTDTIVALRPYDGPFRLRRGEMLTLARYRLSASAP